eukprot:scaffold96993_cov40-Prasinocladus_malaysianus.AAC.2
MLATSSRAQPIHQLRAYSLPADTTRAAIYPRCICRHFRDIHRPHLLRHPQQYRALLGHPTRLHSHPVG